VSRVLAAACALLACGCPVDGPRFTRTSTLEPLPPAREVVVSDFYYQTQHTPQRSDTPAAEARLIEVRDLSEELAAALSSLGVPARAAVHADARALAPGQLLVRGYVMNNGVWPPTAFFLPFMFTLGTGFIIGGLLPYFPLQPKQNCQLKFQVNVLGDDGARVLAHRDFVRAQFTHWFLWTLASNYCFSGRMRAGLVVELARELAAAEAEGRASSMRGSPALADSSANPTSR
jgi:hypothetical protein